MPAPLLERKFFTAGDRGRATAQTLVDSSGAAVDLTGQTVRWELWTVDDQQLVASAAAAVDADPKTGGVSHEFSAEEAAFLIEVPGEYHERWVRIDGSEREERFPTHGVISIWFKRKPGT